MLIISEGLISNYYFVCCICRSSLSRPKPSVEEVIDLDSHELAVDDLDHLTDLDAIVDMEAGPLEEALYKVVASPLHIKFDKTQEKNQPLQAEFVKKLNIEVSAGGGEFVAMPDVDLDDILSSPQPKPSKAPLSMQAGTSQQPRFSPPGDSTQPQANRMHPSLQASMRQQLRFSPPQGGDAMYYDRQMFQHPALPWGYPHPDIVHQHSGMGHPHPGMRHPHPGMGHPHPGMGHPHPGMGYPHPGMGHPHPGMGHPQPGMDNPHLTMNQNPRALFLNPCVTAQGPEKNNNAHRVTVEAELQGTQGDKLVDNHEKKTKVRKIRGPYKKRKKVNYHSESAPSDSSGDSDYDPFDDDDDYKKKLLQNKARQPRTRLNKPKQKVKRRRIISDSDSNSDSDQIDEVGYELYRPRIKRSKFNNSQTMLSGYIPLLARLSVSLPLGPYGDLQLNTDIQAEIERAEPPRKPVPKGIDTTFGHPVQKTLFYEPIVLSMAKLLEKSNISSIKTAKGMDRSIIKNIHGTCPKDGEPNASVSLSAVKASGSKDVFSGQQTVLSMSGNPIQAVTKSLSTVNESEKSSAPVIDNKKDSVSICTTSQNKERKATLDSSAMEICALASDQMNGQRKETTFHMITDIAAETPHVLHKISEDNTQNISFSVSAARSDGSETGAEDNKGTLLGSHSEPQVAIQKPQHTHPSVGGIVLEQSHTNTADNRWSGCVDDSDSDKTVDMTFSLSPNGDILNEVCVEGDRKDIEEEKGGVEEDKKCLSDYDSVEEDEGGIEEDKGDVGDKTYIGGKGCVGNRESIGKNYGVEEDKCIAEKMEGVKGHKECIEGEKEGVEEDNECTEGDKGIEEHKECIEGDKCIEEHKKCMKDEEGVEDQEGVEEHKEGVEDQEGVEEHKECIEGNKEGVEDKEGVKIDKEGVEEDKKGVEGCNEGIKGDKGVQEHKECLEDKEGVEEDCECIEGDKECLEGDKECVEEDKEGVEGDKEGLERNNEGVEGNNECVEEDKEGVEDKEDVEGNKEGVEDKEGVERDKEGVERDKEGVEDNEGIEDKESVEGDKEGIEEDKDNIAVNIDDLDITPSMSPCSDILDEDEDDDDKEGVALSSDNGVIGGQAETGISPDVSSGTVIEAPSDADKKCLNADDESTSKEISHQPSKDETVGNTRNTTVLTDITRDSTVSLSTDRNVSSDVDRMKPDDKLCEWLKLDILENAQLDGHMSWSHSSTSSLQMSPRSPGNKVPSDEKMDFYNQVVAKLSSHVKLKQEMPDCSCADSDAHLKYNCCYTQPSTQNIKWKLMHFKREPKLPKRVIKECVSKMEVTEEQICFPLQQRLTVGNESESGETYDDKGSHPDGDTDYWQSHVASECEPQLNRECWQDAANRQTKWCQSDSPAYISQSNEARTLSWLLSSPPLNVSMSEPLSLHTSQLTSTSKSPTCLRTTSDCMSTLTSKSPTCLGTTSDCMSTLTSKSPTCLSTSSDHVSKSLACLCTTSDHVSTLTSNSRACCSHCSGHCKS